MEKIINLPPFLQTKAVEKYYLILQKKKCSLILKNIFDRLFAIILITLFSPILILFALWIKLDSKGPIFYRQERITQYGRKFKIFKFRTMIVDADKKGSLVTLQNDNRITKVGKLIRKLRFDEIPQLFNVLLGDMSFVGTRPEVSKYTVQYSDEMNAVLLMKAGITSTASILYKDEDRILAQETEKGRSVDEVYVEDILPAKMKYNLAYIKEFSFWHDLKIMLKTIYKVFK